MVEAGVSVVDVAAMTGIHHRTLSEYLSGRRGITRRHVTWLCALFDVEAEELMEGEE